MPLVVTGDARPRVVSGHRRLACALQAGLADVPALVILGELTPREIFLIALISNWASPMEDLDKAVCVRKAVEEFEFQPEEVLSQILPALGLEPHPHILEEYLQTAHLEKTLLETIHRKQLPFRGARSLNKFTEKDQKDFAVKIAARAALTAQELMKTAEWLCGFLKASRLRLEAYLRQENLEPLLAHPVWDRCVKGEKLFQALRQRAFPALAAKESAFEALVKQEPAFSGNIRLEAPAFFEDRGYFLRAQVKKPEDLNRFLALLKDRKEWLNSLFDFML